MQLITVETVKIFMRSEVLSISLYKLIFILNILLTT
jgi:hypothetical protein